MGWQEECTEIKDTEFYFIAKYSEHMGHKSYMYHSRGLDGVLRWSVKPGIAVKYKGDSYPLRDFLEKNADWVALKIPKNASTRWRARKK